MSLSNQMHQQLISRIEGLEVRVHILEDALEAGDKRVTRREFDALQFEARINSNSVANLAKRVDDLAAQVESLRGRRPRG